MYSSYINLTLGGLHGGSDVHDESFRTKPILATLQNLCGKHGGEMSPLRVIYAQPVELVNFAFPPHNYMFLLDTRQSGLIFMLTASRWTHEKWKHRKYWIIHIVSKVGPRWTSVFQLLSSGPSPQMENISRVSRKFIFFFSQKFRNHAK